ncbi:MAG: hypothetical protein AAF805_00055 [Planctomycetota bacterium]
MPPDAPSGDPSDPPQTVAQLLRHRYGNRDYARLLRRATRDDVPGFAAVLVALDRLGAATPGDAEPLAAADAALAEAAADLPDAPPADRPGRWRDDAALARGLVSRAAEGLADDFAAHAVPLSRRLLAILRDSAQASHESALRASLEG